MSQSTTANITDQPAIESLTDTEYHRLLASERRHTLLEVLQEYGSVVDLETVATTIAQRDGTLETVEHIKIDLHHAHLPMLDEMGVIEYEPTAHLIKS